MRNIFKSRKKLHKSTAILLAVSAVVAMLSLNIAYTKAWDNSQRINSSKYNTDAFSTVDAVQFDGEHFTTENLEGTRMTAFNVWETTCSACLDEMGDLEKLSKAYPETDFQLVGICADVYDEQGNIDKKQVDKGKELMSKAGVTFTNIVPTPEMNSYFRETVYGFPTTIFVDSNGKIIATTVGGRDYDSWREKVDQIMEEHMQ